MASPLDIYADLQEEYGRLTQEELANRAAQVSSLGGALSQMKSARGSRLDPQFSALIGALGGAFRNNTSAGAEGLKAYNEAQAQLEADPVNEYNAVGGYLTKETDRITELKKALLAGMKGLKADQGNGWRSDFKVIGNAGVAFNPNTMEVEEIYRNEANSPLYGRIYDEFLKQSLKPELRFEGPDADEKRLAWVANKTDAAMKMAKATDKTRIGSPDPYPTDGGVHRPGMDPNTLPKPVQFSFTPDQIAKFKDPAYLAHVRKSMLPEEAAQFDAWLKAQAPTLAQPAGPVSGAPAAKAASGGPELMTPEILKMKEEQYKNYAKEHAADKDALKSSLSMIPSMSVMKAILSNKDMRMMSGPLHEKLVAGAGYLNYLDPDSKFVKVGDDVPTYFSNMMNLVRDKIQALGSGTAVSNLDLIVTQKSVGDLRNNPEGNKKLLAIMDLQNATLNEKLGKKIGYFESNKNGYEGYDQVAIKNADEPTHIIRRDQNTGNYYVQNKSDWVKEWSAKKKMKPEEIVKYWKNEANDATAKLVDGTSIKFGGR